MLTLETSELNFSLNSKIKSSVSDGGISIHLLINFYRYYYYCSPSMFYQYPQQLNPKSVLACKYRECNNVLFLGWNGRLVNFYQYIICQLYDVCLVLNIIHFEITPTAEILKTFIHINSRYLLPIRRTTLA